MNNQLEDFKRKLERGDISGPTLNFGALPFMVAGLLIFGVIFHLLVGSVIWFMLGILLWSLSNLLDKYKVEQRQGSEAGQVMSGMLARIHPSWADPANMRWQLRILSIACGFIWFSTSFWS